MISPRSRVRLDSTIGSYRHFVQDLLMIEWCKRLWAHRWAATQSSSGSIEWFWGSICFIILKLLSIFSGGDVSVRRWRGLHWTGSKMIRLLLRLMYKSSRYVVQLISFGQQWSIDVILQHLVSVLLYFIMRLVLLLGKRDVILCFVWSTWKERAKSHWIVGLNGI